jgi:SNF2 family DNA or RNA helicase
MDNAAILNLVSGAPEYRKGEELFNKDLVTNFAREYVSGGIEYSAFVDNRFVKIKTDRADKFISYRCDCKASSIWRGGCEHMAALLFYVKNYIAKSEINELNKKNAEILESEYKNFFLKSIKTAPETLTSLFPVIYPENPPRLGFEIGSDKTYIVKDIEELLINVKNEKYFSYGKGLSFLHSEAAFDDVSIKLLGAARKIYSTLRAGAAGDKNFAFFGAQKTLPLSPDSLDSLLKAAPRVGISGKNIEFKADCPAKDEISLAVKNIENKIAISITGAPLFILEGVKYDYYVYTGKIAPVKKDRAEFLRPLIKAGTAIFTEENAYVFYGIILPLAAKFGYLPPQINPPPAPRVYLDIKDAKIFAAVEKNLFLEKALVKFGFEKHKDALVLSDRALSLNFFSKGVKKLSEIAEIISTENFQRQSYLPDSPRLAFNISARSDLLEISLDSPDYTLSELIETLKTYSGERYVRLKSGRFIDSGNDSVAAALGALKDINAPLKGETIRLKKYQAVLLNENFGNFDLEIKEILADLRKPRDYAPPESLVNILREYQKTGYKWLKTLAFYEFGGLLADDMGLGKTLQISSLLESEEKTAPSLVVCPTSLIYNWAREIEKFSNKLTAVIVTGSAERRREILAQNDPNIFIATYDTIKRDLENYLAREFKYVIADEAQNIKNPKTQNARALKQLRSRANFALTGTPIENKLEDLKSVFDFILPEYLNINNSIQKIKTQIAPFVMRRSKKEVLKELPPKIESVYLARMTDEQEKLYNGYLLEARGEIGELTGNERDRGLRVLTLITRLRQICCEPSLFLKNYKGGSGKLEAALELLFQSVESGRRILLFSQFAKMLEIIKKRLDGAGAGYFYLDGATKPKNRAEMVENFNGGERDIFLISLKAGGAGLNLTGADMVIHYDPWWNYSVMGQATDRAYRIGQQKSVQVINMVAKNSIEEKILKLQEKKKDLIEKVLENNSAYLNNVTYEDLISLFEAN